MAKKIPGLLGFCTVKRGVVFGLLAAIVACGRGKPADQAANPPATSQASPVSTGGSPAAARDVSLLKPTTPVEFEQIAGLLPELSGWTRTKPRGEQVTMGVPMSRASATYTQGDSEIDVEITDSSFNQLVLSPMTIFLSVGFSERSSEGYTKSAPVNGSPGFEKWNGDAKRAEVTVVVNSRFIVQGIGHNVDDVAPVRALVKAVDLAKLAQFK